MRLLKTIFWTVAIVGVTALTVTLIYFLTIFGGALILIVVVGFLVREYFYDDGGPTNGPPDRI